MKLSDRPVVSFVPVTVFTVLTLFTTTLFADDDDKAKRAPQLQPVFSDDFSADSRDKYQIEGEVSWKPGQLTLANGASITHQINGGPWAKVELDFGENGWAAGPTESSCNVVFKFDIATDCYIKFQKKTDNQGELRYSVSVLDISASQGVSTPTVVKTSLLPETSIGGFSVEYRYGLIEIKTNEENILTAFIENEDAAVVNSTIEASKGELGFRSWEGLSCPFSKTLQLQVEKALGDNKQLFDLWYKGKLRSALRKGEKASSVFRRIYGDDHPDYATALGNLALVNLSLGNYSAADSLYRKCRRIISEARGKRHENYAAVLCGHGVLYLVVGEYNKAEPLLLSALRIQAAELGTTHPDYASTLDNLASLLAATGRYVEAERLYTKAQAIRRDTVGENHASYAVSLNNLASLYEKIGEIAPAESLHLQALDIRMGLFGKMHHESANSLNNLSLFYQRRNLYAKAEPLALEALEVNKHVLGEQHLTCAKNLLNLADLYTRLGNYSRAKSLYLSALATIEKEFGMRHPAFAAGLSGLATVYEVKGDFKESESLLRQAKKIRERSLGDLHPVCASNLVSLCDLFHKQGDFARALIFSTTAFRARLWHSRLTIPSLSGAQTRSWIGVNAPRADINLALLRNSPDSDSVDAYFFVWNTKGLLSRLQAGRQPPSDASKETREVFGQLRDTQLKLAKLVTAVPSPSQAVSYRVVLAEQSEKKEALEKRISELSSATSHELAIRDASVEQLLQQLPEGVAVVDFVQLNDWEYVNTDITLQNDEGEAEVRTVKKAVPRPVYDAFVLRFDRAGTLNPADWVPLGAAEPIETAISNWRVALTGEDSVRSLGTKSSAVGSKPKIVADRPADILRKRIWDKLEPHLDGIHTVVLLSDGALNRLPWAALPGRNDGQYLIHDYALTTASTGQQLYGHLIDPPIDTPPQLLAVGGIDYDNRTPQRSQIKETPLVASAGRALLRSDNDQKWGALSGAADEADAVVKLWGQRGPVQQLRGAAAKEQSLAQRLPQSRFAHLATHGFFDQGGEVYGKNLREQDLFQTSFSKSQQASVAFRNPLLMTGIVMAGANVPPAKDDLGLPVGEDGILTAEELSGLDLRNTELVTLSACETGLGDVAAGDGVYGLTRVLHKSGVRSVVASQWKVDDIATRELMKRFYENLWVKKQSKIDALRNAQLWMLEHPDQLSEMGVADVTAQNGSAKTGPYFWAAFQLSGDWR